MLGQMPLASCHGYWPKTLASCKHLRGKLFQIRPLSRLFDKPVRCSAMRAWKSTTLQTRACFRHFRQRIANRKGDGTCDGCGLTQDASGGCPEGMPMSWGSLGNLSFWRQRNPHGKAARPLRLLQMPQATACHHVVREQDKVVAFARVSYATMLPPQVTLKYTWKDRRLVLKPEPARHAVLFHVAPSSCPSGLARFWSSG